MIFGQSWGAPWEGKNPGLVQGHTTGPHHRPLTGGYCLSVPGSIPAQRERRATRDWVDQPPRACRRPDHTDRVGAEAAWPLPALILPKAIDRVGVAHGTCYCPAGARLAPAGLGAHRQSGGDKGCHGGGRFSLPGPCGGALTRPSPDHNPPEAPRQPRVPQSTPGWYLGACCTGVGRPTLGGGHAGRRCADQGACCAPGTATRGRRCRRHRVELGAAGKTPDAVGRIGQLPDSVLGGIATVRQAPAGTTGPLLGPAIEAITSPRTARTLRQVARLGLVRLEGECAP